MRAFRDSLQETVDLAGQHEVIAETMSAAVVSETYNLIKEVKEERKKVRFASRPFPLFVWSVGVLAQHTPRGGLCLCPSAPGFFGTSLFVAV